MAHSILTTAVLVIFTVIERGKSDEEIEMEREKECPGYTVVNNTGICFCTCLPCGLLESAVLTLNL